VARFPGLCVFCGLSSRSSRLNSARRWESF
jgi:hypothetical protein